VHDAAAAIGYALLQVLGEETKGEAIITTGVGQHQMWAAQWYPYREPRSWVTSGGWADGDMGQVAWRRHVHKQQQQSREQRMSQIHSNE
jgi:acetolactate synthase-1/2/3 large subunit